MGDHVRAGRDHVCNATSRSVTLTGDPRHISQVNVAGFISPSHPPPVMKFSSLLRSLTALALVTVAIAEDASDVVDVTPSNFDAIKSEPLVLLEFFAPW